MRKVFVLAVSVVAAGLLSALQVSCSNPSSGGPDGNRFVLFPGINIAVGTIAADYSAANFEIISAEDDTAEKNLIPGLHTDIAVRAYGRAVYILERMGKDNVIKYGDGGEIYQQNIGTGVNIQDIAVVSETKAYISCYNDANLIVFNPTSGTKTSTISLARFNTYAGTDSAETTPYASALAVKGNYVYVACQRLKGFSPADISLIAVIDTRADTVFTSIKLNKKNPAAMDVFGDRLLVSSSGDYYDPTITGGVEMIDLTNNTNLGVKVEESALGGTPSNVVFVSSDKAYIGVMGADWSTAVKLINPTAGTAGAAISGITDGSGGLAYDGSKLYVGERGFGATTGVVVVNPKTNAVERTVATGMPPSSIAIIFGN